jgi:TolA-binding protein
MQRFLNKPPEGRIEVLQPAQSDPAPAAEPAQPEREIPTAPAVAPDEDPNSIRLLPQGGQRDPAREQLDKANSIYARKMHDLAAVEYEKFLSEYPGAPGRDAALFRLGECYRVAGDSERARQAFERLTTEFREGEFLGAGAYRLGEMLFADSKYEPALRQFESAINYAGSAEVRLSAKYQAGRCLDRLGRASDAIPLFREVVEIENNNPYREYARLALAGALASSGQKAEALTLYESVATPKNPPILQAEAAVKAGALASELGDKKRAEQLFESVVKMSEAGQWKAVAFLGALRLYAASQDHKKLTSISDNDLELLAGDYQAEALALMASSFRATNNNARALEFYQRLAKKFPKSPAARKARFQRIVVLHEAGDKTARAELEAFLADADEAGERERGTLLLAELLFQEGRFADAAKSYGAILNSGLPSDLKRQAEFKYGWCLANANNPAEAVKVFTGFLEKYPDSDFAAAAHAQRGLARQQLKDYKPALEDFQKIIDQWPKSPERELALQQKALILGQLEDYDAMKAAFLEFLEAYPKTKGRAQAEYWIGWADFEKKDYKAALPRLSRARELEPSTYADRAGIRIALCYYYTENRTELLGELGKLKAEALPADVYRWLGLRSAQEGDFAAADKALSLVVASGKPDAETWIVLAESRNTLGRPAEALQAADSYLALVQDPYARARGLLVVAEARRGLKEFGPAQTAAEEALMLQPEGRLNAVGRMTVAEIAFSKGEFEAAAKAFLSVALLYEDPTITPRALQRAAESYQRADNPEEAEKISDELKRRFPDFQTTTRNIS